MLDIEPAAQEVIRLLDGVTEHQLSSPTPCAGTSVAAMLDHLMGLSMAFTDGARKAGEGNSAGGPRADADRLDPDWRAVLPKRLHELVEAWRDPSAWEGMTEVGGVSMPAEQMGVVAVDELVLHGWDLARGTGQPFRCGPASTAAVLAFTTYAAQPQNAAVRNGLFGPVVAVPEDAPAFDRALGFAGRDPAWSPPSQ